MYKNKNVCKHPILKEEVHIRRSIIKVFGNEHTDNKDKEKSGKMEKRKNKIKR